MDGWTALHLACHYGHSETVQIIIQYSTEYNINLNSKTNNGYTPFQLACENGLSEVVEILLQVTFSLKTENIPQTRIR